MVPSKVSPWPSGESYAATPGEDRAMIQYRERRKGRKGEKVKK
jgi:hypothetical protein